MNLLPADQKILHPHLDSMPREELVDRWKEKLPAVEIKLIQKLASRELLEMGYDIFPVYVSFTYLLVKHIKYLLGYVYVRIMYPPF